MFMAFATGFNPMKEILSKKDKISLKLINSLNRHLSLCFVI